MDLFLQQIAGTRYLGQPPILFDKKESYIMIIRRARIEDSRGLSSLMNQLGYSHSISSMRKRLKVCMDSGVYYCLVAAVEKHIIALAFLVIYPSCYKNSNRCLLEALIVDQKHRRQGIGRKLIKLVEKLAQEHNCSSISLISNMHRDKEVLEFYTNLGYHNDGPQAQIYLRKPLVPQTSNIKGHILEEE